MSSKKGPKGRLQTKYKKNDILTVSITDIGSGGEGIGRKDGYILFVKDALIGDTVKVCITKAQKKYAYARLLKIEKPSEYRIDPPCPISKPCGGCQIQALRYDRQLAFKQDKVREDLIRIGGFEDDFADRILRPVIGMEQPYRYRNKAQVPVGMRGSEPVTGFYAGRTHYIVPMQDCLIGDAVNQKILKIMTDYMKENQVSAYDEETGEGFIRHVLIRSGRATGQIMVCIIVNGEKLPQEKELTEQLMHIPGMTSVSLNTNKEKTNVILGKKLRVLAGRPFIEDTLRIYQVVENPEKEVSFIPSEKEVRFRISPHSFYQVNPQQTEKLYSIALSFAGLTGRETVWDLYCGIGTISLFLARHAGKVYGVEIVPQAIEDAKENARINGIENAFFYTGKAEEVLPAYRERMRKEGSSEKVDVIVVDPPRKGCDRKCLDTILDIAPERIVYVSCDPATLARDLKILTDGGYELKAVRPVDQFAHTVHVEVCCLMSRVKD